MSEDEFGNIVIKKRMHRQIEEVVYGVDEGNDFDKDVPSVRGGSIYEAHNDLDAVDEDEFDRIIENEKIRKSMKVSPKKKRNIRIEEE